VPDCPVSIVTSSCSLAIFTKLILALEVLLIYWLITIAVLSKNSKVQVWFELQV
jgi:hypothetical protein